jgi:hypothetical protein
MIIQQHNRGILVKMTAIELILKHKANIIFILFIVLYIGSCYYSYNAGVNNGRVEQCNLMGGTLAWVHDVKEEPYIDCISDSKRNFYNEKN